MLGRRFYEYIFGCHGLISLADMIYQLDSSFGSEKYSYDVCSSTESIMFKGFWSNSFPLELCKRNFVQINKQESAAVQNLIFLQNNYGILYIVQGTTRKW